MDTKSVENDSENLEIEVRPIDEDSDVIEYFDDTPTDKQKKLRGDIRKDIEEKFWADAENLKRTLGEDFYNKLAWENIIQENATPEEIKNILQDLNNKAKNFSKLDGIAKKYGKDFEWADKVVTMQNDAVNKIISGASFDEVINGLAADYRNIDLSLQKDSHRMLHSGQYRPDYCPNDSPYTPCLQGGRYGAYYERFKNMIDSNNALSPLFENAPMTRLEYDATNGRVIMQHPAADNIPLAMNHVEKIHNNLQELVNKVKSSQQLSPTEQVFIDESIAEIHYTLSHAMPWARGSNGIIDSYVRSLYKSLGLDLPALKNNVSLDLEAFCTDLETFKNKWCSQEFFEQTVVDLETKLNVNSSVVDHPVIPSSKYEIDELGFIKTSEYSKLSNDELIEEYTKLKAYEDDGKNIVLNNSNRNSDDCQVVVNTHSRYTERDAIKTELDKRGLKLDRMHVDGKTVYTYSKKTIATDAPSNTPTADVDVKYNEVGRKMTKGYGNKDIID
ncbi:hypothetical protein IJO12_04310, partial [bacterium]|nr:hypothetical protein [bacterium]